MQDLLEQFTYIGQDSADAAHRFLAAAEAAFERLAEMPGIGSQQVFRNPDLQGVRQWRIPGFENYLIFYRPLDDEIEVLGVLQSSPRYPAHL